MRLPPLWMRLCLTATWLLASPFGAAQAAAPTSPVVLELFTSQSCSSCPAADALLQRIAARDPAVLALTYHVDYWDHLSWKDTYSSPASTRRQQGYVQALGMVGLFTPQLVVDGMDSVVGSKERAVADAISKVRQTPPSWTVSITPEAGKLAVRIAAPSAADAELWEIRFDRQAKTPVRSGENGGRVLESIHNVTHINFLGKWSARSPLAIEPVREGGVAVLVQAPGQGRILAAASYLE